MTDIRAEMFGQVMKRCLDLEEQNAQLRNFVADFWIGGTQQPASQPASVEEGLGLLPF